MRQKTIQKNDRIELEIESVSRQGSGVGRYNDFAVFVPATAAGDRVLVQVLKVKPRYAFAKLCEILRPSPDRAENDCPVFPQCGGCAFRHLQYSAELAIKEVAVRDAFLRIGKIEITPQPILGAERTQRYRNKAQYPVVPAKQGHAIGFYARNSHRVVPCADCKLQPETFAGIVDTVSAWMTQYAIPAYDEQTQSGLLRHIYIRRAQATDRLHLCLVINGRKLPHSDTLLALLHEREPRLSGVSLNYNMQDSNVILDGDCYPLWGEMTLTEQLCGVDLRLSPLSFLQVNREQTQRLYTKAAEYAALTGKETLLDLYCGIGSIGLSMAKQAGTLIGVEAVPQAVEDARQNTQQNGITNAQFLCMDAAKAAQLLRERGIRPDVVLLDPPRKGCSPQTIAALQKLRPARIVYISCDPATLARDCASLQEQGFRLQEVTPVDLFPGTGHVETVCLLSKLNTEHHIELDLELDELDLTSSESKATYEEIKDYVLKTTGLKLSSLYISQVKRKLGLEVGVCYNLPKSDNARVPECPAEKETAITAALKHFEMIWV